MAVATSRADCLNRRRPHKRGDVVCLFSNGGFGGIHGMLLERLKFRK
jgi:hypothetical protein